MKNRSTKNDWLIVKLEPEKKPTTGSITYDDPKPKNYRLGKILRVGSGAFYSGKFVSVENDLDLKTGDRICFDYMAAMRFLTDDIVAMKPSDVIEVIDEDDTDYPNEVNED